MRIGLLLCDETPTDRWDEFGAYTDMFVEAFSAAGSAIEFIEYRVFEGNFPDGALACDGYLITGSTYSVFEPVDWIKTLLKFVATAANERLPIVGICFGHQVLAVAMGGVVERSSRGWGLGVTSYQFEGALGHVGEPEEINLLVSHQDQVSKLPGGFFVHAGNEFCPNFVIGNGQNLLGIQGHPEFSHDYCRTIIEARKDIIGEQVYSQSLASLTQPHSGRAFISQIDQFFCQYK